MTETPAAEIRLATPADAPAIARVHVLSRVRAYRDLLSADLLAAESVEGRERMWNTRLAQPDGRCWLAEEGGELLGFAYAARARDPELGPECAELVAIYLLPEHNGAGHGRRLVERSIADLRSRDFGDVVVWVAVENEAAVGFYAAMGFTPDTRADTVPFGETGLRKRRLRLVPGRVPPVSGSD